MDKRDFLKISAAFCGGAIATQAVNSFGFNKIEKETPALPEEKAADLEFTKNWTKDLMNELGKIEQGEKTDVGEAIGNCSQMCYDSKHLDEELTGFTSASQFASYLEKEWGWKVQFDEAAGVLLCDENKDHCLCPIVRATCNALSGSICCCTSGMLKRIFKRALGRDVKAEIVRSVVRDGKSCIYRITL